MPPRILLVEDDEDTREVLAVALAETLGVEVEAAEDGRAAVAALERGGAYDLLLTDERMPGLTGSQLVRRVRAEGLVPRCVLMSAYQDGATLAKEAGADLFLSKPFELTEATPKLRRLLEPTEWRN